MLSQNLRILVIDDDQDYTELVQHWLLRNHGKAFHVDIANDFETGLQKLLTESNDACLLDYRLGMSDGIELLEAAQARGCRVPVIMLTSHGSREVDLRATHAGAADYLDKETLNAKTLERSLRYAVATRRLQTERARLLSIVEATPDFIGSIDVKTGYAVYLNQGGRQMIGLSPAADVTRMHLSDLLDPAALAPLKGEAFDAVLRDGSWSGETRFKHADGSEIPVWMVLTAHRDEKGRVEYVSTVSRDLTARREAELKIASLASFPADNMGPVIRIAANDQLLYANKAAKELMELGEGCVGRPAPAKLIALADVLRESQVSTQQEVQFGERIFLFATSQVKNPEYLNIYGVDVT
jgi:PAS domain S-box-containing protein